MWNPWIPGGFHLESMGECKVLEDRASSGLTWPEMSQLQDALTSPREFVAMIL